MRQPLAFLSDDAVELLPFCLIDDKARLQRLAEHPDKGEWCFQFVRDVRDEVGLQLRNLHLVRSRPDSNKDSNRHHQDNPNEQRQVESTLAADKCFNGSSLTIKENHFP